MPFAWQAQAADFIWDNGAGTGRWNTTSANWSGFKWVNSSSNHAFFDAVGGTVSLRIAVTAGSVNFGSTTSNTPDVTLTGATSLFCGALTVQGKSDNPGDYAGNPSLTLSVPTVSVAGDIAVGRANLVISSGTVTADRIISSAASPDWARLVISGGTVTATNGVDGSVNTAATFAIDLNGGTLRTPSIRVADRNGGTNNSAWLTFNGGTLQATADNPDFITLYGGNQNAYIGSGGAVIDTNGHAVGINVNLLASGGGGLTKSGTGTLTLSGQNGYPGTTRVDGGVLSLANLFALPAAGGVEIASGAMMDLGYSGSIAVGSLLLNGVSQSSGVYSEATHPGYFTGTGQLVVPPALSNAFVWDNGAGTGQWNTTDANWSGATWVNSSSNDAFFSSLGGTVSLGVPITAGSVNFGSSTANAPDVTLTGDSLVSASLTVQGNSANGGTYAGNPSLTLALPTVSVAGDISVGRANLVVSSGAVTVGRIISSFASPDWARLVVAGGTVTATSGVDGSVNTAATFAIDLNGGTLRTPSVRVADREGGNNNSAWFTFNGGTLQATADNPDFITFYGGNQNAHIGNGGAVIDTAGHEVGIRANLQASGVGGLSKIGQGTLVLTGVNTYFGPTTVHEGTLRIIRPTTRMEVKPGAMLELDFSGNYSLRELVIDGVSLPTGVYSASTHPGRLTGTGSLTVATAASGYSDTPWPGITDGVSSFRRMKYGYFVHYVLGGVRKSDGTWPSDANDLADRFDAAGFAEDLQSMGVEYVIFTAWHYNVVCLWPSPAMERWMPGHTVNRDLLSDMIDAVKAKGIRVLFYTHPRDGHDMNTADQITTGWGPGIPGDYNPDWSQFNRQKWNDFINDIYADLIDRYGSRIDGLFIDEGSAYGDSYRVVDYPRLRQTIKSRQPDLLMMHNYYGNNYSCDIGATEVSYWQAWVPGTDPNHWPATGRPMSMVMGGAWSAIEVPGTYAPRYNTTEMFRMTVLRAGVNSTDGGGVNWAGGPYAGGGWETGVLEQMQQIGSWIAPIRASICNTYPSQSWITPPNSTINSLSNGIVATRSATDGREFIHVLTPPAGNSLTVPAPADGRGYTSASLHENGHTVDLVRNDDGSLTLTLQSGDAWAPRNTVIALEPVTVTWNGNDAGDGTAAWSDSVDHFTGGFPVATRFRTGDNVNFSLPGAATVIPSASDFAVGDLRFSGKDHLIQPSGTSTITLSSGRIDVAAGITATFQETGSGGPLTLAGDSGLTKTGDGTLVLDLPSRVTGNTVLTSGVVAVRNGALGSQGNIVFNGGTLRLLPGNQADDSSRIRHGDAPVRIDTGGNDVAWATPLHASNTGGLIKLGGGTLALAGGTSMPSGPVTIAAGSLKLELSTSGAVLVPNPGFETPAYNSQGWAYEPTDTGWTFNPSGGSASNNTPWVGTSPEAVQVAFLQNYGTMSAEVSASADGHYRLSFLAANRPGYLASGLVIALDGVQLAVYQPGQIGQGGDFNRFELPAARITAGSHTLSFQGLQNGSDSATLVDDIRFTAAEAGALPAGASLALTGAGSAFDPGPGTVTLDALAGVAGSTVTLADTSLVITGNDRTATFAGNISGPGNLTITGTLRLIGDAAIHITGSFTNTGVLDIMTWNGTLPAGFVNNGIVLNRSAVKIDTYEIAGNAFSVTLKAYSGHTYQLQRSQTLSDDWQNIGSPIAGDDAAATLTDPDGAGASRMFYRVFVTP